MKGFPRMHESPAEDISPADILRNRVLPGRTQGELAEALGVSRLTVSQLLNGHRGVSPEMALRLAYVLGTSAKFWLDLQQRVDLADAERKLGNKLSSLRVLRPVQTDSEILKAARTKPIDL